MRRHFAGTPLGNCFRHARTRTTVQPDIIGQVRSTKCLVAGTISAVASHAQHGEFLLAAHGCILINLAATQAIYIFGHVSNAGFTTQCRFPARHHASSAIEDSLLDGFRLTTV